MSIKHFLTVAALLAAIAGAQVAPLTQITGTLTNTDGSNFTGQLYVAWPEYSIGTVHRAAGSMPLTVSNGAMNLSLPPTDQMTPTGTAYTVTLIAPGHSTVIAKWSVPTSASAVNISSIYVPSGSGSGSSGVATPAFTGAAKATNGSGTLVQAACADLSNAAASCATDATNASNISSGTLAAARVAALNQSTTGNAATATSLATMPTPCSAGQAPTGVLASGNSTGCTTYIQTDAVPTVFGRAGAVVAAGGDYTAAQVTNAASTASANAFGTTSSLFNQTVYGDFLMNSGATAAEQYHLEGRVGVGIPVPNLTPTANNSAIAFDIFPHGLSPTNFTTIGVAWEDICNSDINTSGSNYSCLRMGIRTDGTVILNSQAAGTGLLGNMLFQQNGGLAGVNLGTNVQPLSQFDIAAAKTTALNSATIWNTSVTLRLIDSTAMAAGVGGVITFVGNTATGGAFRNLAGIGAAKTNSTSADLSGDLVFYSTINATQYPTEGARLSNSLGTFGIKLGNKYTCTHGSNATCGVGTLSSGVLTVAYTPTLAAAASGAAGDSLVYHYLTGGTAGWLANPVITSGTGFTISCYSAPATVCTTDSTSTVYWEVRHIN